MKITGKTHSELAVVFGYDSPKRGERRFAIRSASVLLRSGWADTNEPSYAAYRHAEEFAKSDEPIDAYHPIK